MLKPLNIFYEEPDPDRWLPFDRFPRKFIRELIRGKPRPGGVMMVALELMRGLDLLGLPYRFNDYKHIEKHPEEVACIIGKPHLLLERKWKNPIVFGAGIFSHPVDDLDLLIKFPNIKKILVPGPWMKDMFEPFYPGFVISWPVGIDTTKWYDMESNTKNIDFLIYNKIRWDNSIMDKTLIQPLKAKLKFNGFNFEEITYGNYNHDILLSKLSTSKAVIFICEHETQGIAYQQILSTNTPILAWDKGEYWIDPYYYPDRVKYKPVSSVPYWDNSCGCKFKGIEDFDFKLNEFISNMNSKVYKPREFILNNITLEKCALDYYNIIKNIDTI